MQEVFYEESIGTRDTSGSKTKYIIVKIASIFSFIIGVVFTFMLLFAQNTAGLLFSLVIAVLSYFLGFFYRRKKDAFFLDYDYTFISGSIRISKIFNNKRRKSIAVFNTTEILQLGKFGSNSYLDIEKNKQNKKIIATPNPEPGAELDFYYIQYTGGGERKYIILECSEKFMYHVLKASNKSVLEPDFK